jgi:hypothetical protein
MSIAILWALHPFFVRRLYGLAWVIGWIADVACQVALIVSGIGHFWPAAVVAGLRLVILAGQA